jgi:hypothetical protein
MDRLLVTRFAELLLPPSWRQSGGERALRWLTRPLLDVWWKLQTWLVRRLCRMPRVMVPDWALPQGLEQSGVGCRFYRMLQSRQLTATRDALVSIAGPTTLVLRSGERIDADCIIFATGWQQDVSFLDHDLHRLVLRSGTFRLFRQVLPPEEPHLGFVGYASSTTCPLTSELAAHWLSSCFAGGLSLPSVARMDREIARVAQWAHAVFPSRDSGFFIGPYIAQYADDLMADMGLRQRRRRYALVEYLSPFWSERYRTVAAERAARIGGRLTPQEAFS